MSGNKKEADKGKGEKIQGIPLKNKITELLELPKEIVMNLPKITMVGNSDLMVENYKGILEYECERIRMNTGSGVLKITGRKLMIREITSEDILISGVITAMEFCG